LLLIVARSFLATKKQNGLEACRNVLKISCADLWPSAKPGGYWPVRRGRRFVYVGSIGYQRESPFTSHFSPITSHGRASGLAVRLQNLFLILSQCVDLGLLTITAAFRAACHLKKILDSGFEMIRISQCDVTGLIRQANRELGASYPAAFMIFFSW
jgi:hypothetical protein